MNKTIGISEFLNVDTSDECLQFISDGIGHNKQLMKNNILRSLESRELTYFKEFIESNSRFISPIFLLSSALLDFNSFNSWSP